MARRIPGTLKLTAVALAACTGWYWQTSSASPSSDSVATSLPAVATAPQRYVAQIGDSQFKVSHLEQQSNGYTIESGALVDKQGRVEGGLILVRSRNGALTGIVSRQGKSGLLQVSKSGEQRFFPAPAYPLRVPDTLPGAEEEQVSEPLSATAEPVFIDVLVGYTQAALDKLSGNPVSHALAQMEAVNLSLRNSNIDNIQLRLAGVRVLAEDIRVSSEGLARWDTLLTALRPTYRHDLNVGYSIIGDANGLGYKPGHTSVNWIEIPTVVKHEVGHNVGGDHCSDYARSNYKFGHNNGDIRTSLCIHSEDFYYSTPDVVVNGRTIGDARYADMARLWREQAGRLSGYSPAYDGLRSVHVGEWSFLHIPVSGATSRPYFVATDSKVGPTEPAYPGPGLTKLNVTLRSRNNTPVNVVIQASCLSALNTPVPINSLHGCNYASQAVLRLRFDKQYNPQLPAGWYNGTVELKLVTPQGEKKILTSLSVKS